MFENQTIRHLLTLLHQERYDEFNNQLAEHLGVSVADFCRDPEAAATLPMNGVQLNYSVRTDMNQETGVLRYSVRVNAYALSDNRADKLLCTFWIRKISLSEAFAGATVGALLRTYIVQTDQTT